MGGCSAVGAALRTRCCRVRPGAQCHRLGRASRRHARNHVGGVRVASVAGPRQHGLLDLDGHRRRWCDHRCGSRSPFVAARTGWCQQCRPARRPHPRSREVDHRPCPARLTADLSRRDGPRGLACRHPVPRLDRCRSAPRLGPSVAGRYGDSGRCGCNRRRGHPLSDRGRTRARRGRPRRIRPLPYPGGT